MELVLVEVSLPLFDKAERVAAVALVASNGFEPPILVRPRPSRSALEALLELVVPRRTALLEAVAEQPASAPLRLSRRWLLTVVVAALPDRRPRRIRAEVAVVFNRLVRPDSRAERAATVVIPPWQWVSRASATVALAAWPVA